MLNYVQSPCTINMIITTRNPRANQHVVSKNFLFTKTTHTVLSRIYYTQILLEILSFVIITLRANLDLRRSIVMCALSDLGLFYKWEKSVLFDVIGSNGVVNRAI